MIWPRTTEIRVEFIKGQWFSACTQLMNYDAWLPVVLSVAPGLNQPTSEHVPHFYKHVTEGVGSAVHDVVQQLVHRSLHYNHQMVPAFSKEKSLLSWWACSSSCYSQSPSTLQCRTRQAHKQTERTCAAAHIEKLFSESTFSFGSSYR